MIRGLYTSASGLLVQWSRQDVISNNLANINTCGFKRDEVLVKAFPYWLIHRINDVFIETCRGRLDLRPPIGYLGTGANIEEVKPIFELGKIVETNNKLDVALISEGFFTVSTPQGLRYTRCGAFKLNANGELVTSDGLLVLGERGPIRIVGKEVAFTEDGYVFVDNVPVDRLRIRTFYEIENLEKIGHNFYFPHGEAGVEVTPDTIELKQGFLELSNVNTVQEMVKMIEAARTYEACQRLVQSQDETLDRVINQVGEPAS